MYKRHLSGQLIFLFWPPYLVNPCRLMEVVSVGVYGISIWARHLLIALGYVVHRLHRKGVEVQKSGHPSILGR